MPEAPQVVAFSDPRCRQVALAGGKGASLATMTAEGLPVPPGFVIPADVLASVVDVDELRATELGTEALDRLERASARVVLARRFHNTHVAEARRLRSTPGRSAPRAPAAAGPAGSAARSPP